MLNNASNSFYRKSVKKNAFLTHNAKKNARIIGNGLNLGFVKKNLSLGKNSGVFMVKEDLGFGKKTSIQEKLRFLW